MEKVVKNGGENNRSPNPHVIISEFKRMLESPRETTSNKEISRYLKDVANRLVQSPESLEFFYRYNQVFKKENPQDSLIVDNLEREMDSSIREVGVSQNVFGLSEKQLQGFLRLSKGESLLSDETNKELPVDEGVCAKRAELVIKSFFDSCLNPYFKENDKSMVAHDWKKSGKRREIEDKFLDSQIKITELMYRLSTAALSSHDPKLIEEILSILAFETNYMRTEDVLSYAFVMSFASLNDDTFAKRTRIDILGGLLEDLFSPEQKRLASKGAQVVEKFDGDLFEDITASLSKRDEKRSLKLIDYTNQNRPFGEVKVLDKEDIIDFLVKPHRWPDSLIYKADKFMLLYFDLFSKHLLNKGQVTSPVEVVVTADSNLIYIAVPEGDNWEIASEVMSRIMLDKEKGQIEDPLFASSVLRYMRPKMEAERGERLRNKNVLVKEKLASPTRGISKDGIVVKIDQKKNSDISLSEVQYDFSGRKVRLNFNGNFIDLIIDHADMSLKLPNGKDLLLDEFSRLWWEDVIFSPLEKLVCSDCETDWFIAGTEGRPLDEALDIKRKTILKRIGHLRREPPGKGYTEEQRSKVMSLRFPLPGIESLDLEVLNKTKGYSKKDGQYTYVLPLERESTGVPIAVTVPGAFDF